MWQLKKKAKSKRKRISQKQKGEFEPLKRLNISDAVSELELNGLEHVQIKFSNNPEWEVRFNTEDKTDAKEPLTSQLWSREVFFFSIEKRTSLAYI